MVDSSVENKENQSLNEGKMAKEDVGNNKTLFVKKLTVKSKIQDEEGRAEL